MSRSIKCLLLLLFVVPVQAGQALLTLTPPTLNTDGTTLTNIASYEIWHGCTESGVYDVVEIIPPTASHTITGLPDVGTCYVMGKVINTDGIASAVSGEVSKFMGGPNIPGVVTDLSITWQPSSNEMTAVSYDFTADSVGVEATSNGDTSITGFTLATNTGFPWEAIITSDASFEESRGCKVYDPSGQGDIFTIMHETGTIGDVVDSTPTEVLAQFRIQNQAQASSYWPIIMRNEGADLESFMALGSNADETKWRIVYYNGANEWTFSPEITKVGFAIGDIVWARMSVNASNEWSLTMWEGAVGDEPAKDLTDVTWADSATLLGGHTGFGGRDNSETPYEWGWFAVGVGEAAPGPGGGPDRDIVATLVDVSFASPLADVNATRNLSATRVDTSFANLLATLGLQRDLTPLVVDVAIADLDAEAETNRDVIATLTDVSIADLDAALSFGADRELIASLAAVNVGDLNADLRMQRDLSPTVVDVTIAKLDAVIGRARDILATVVNVIVRDFNATITGPSAISTFINIAQNVGRTIRQKLGFAPTETRKDV